ncbi:ATP-binding protein [Hyalangium sp.]|uniref:sensor histidine kinase n=1 Tax=Hyalangium sp. TaxID=2028555 RepID=UPI002D6C3EEF|nr:ATP-binding protein [Hyalangium sp.]HYI02191.1 ATP-binding protein [Hyalangium sp.]
MRRLSSFRTKAMAGYAAVVLLLAGGMTFAIRRLDVLAAGQIAHFRMEEDEITLVERLRWSGEVLVSTGRGFLLSGDAALLATLHEAEGDFDRSFQALKNDSLSPSAASLVAEVERAATSFTRRQKQLVTARQQDVDTGELARRFETELLPLQHELGQSLNRLVDYKEAALKDAYAQGTATRAQLSSWMHSLLGVLVLISLGTSWYFSRLLAQSYRQEQDALETAQKALATRDELMGIIAHDLRNPLNAIKLKATLLRKGAESEKFREHAESIEHITLRMEHLIRSMLDVATLEAGRLSVTPAPCDMAGLLREAVEMFSNLSAAKPLGLQLRGVNMPGLTVRADRERVLQVFSNLLGNAIKFTPQGGQVVIAVERQGEAVRIAVSDSGPGIASEHLPHVFDRFWKHEKAGKKGTGLGLFIAKGIIDGHGGRIWAESEPGHGATFSFTLPIAESARAEASPTESGDHPTPA